MPASITQYLFGKAVAEQLPVPVTAAFCWGLQAEPAVPLTALPTAQGKQIKQEKKEFLFGLQINAAFFRLLFPYIMKKAAFVQTLLPEQPKEVVLQEVCSALDTVMLRRECGLLPADFDFSLVFPLRQATLQEISAFAASAVGGEPERILADMQQKAKTFCCYRDRTALKKLWYLRREKNGAHTVSCQIRPMTEDPDWDVAGVEEGEEETDFFTLFDRVVEETARNLRTSSLLL